MQMSSGSLKPSVLIESKTYWTFFHAIVKATLSHCRGAAMIDNDTQLHQAQADIQKLWRFLESARQTHSSLDYERMAAPYLLQIQERQQEVLIYLSANPTAADA
jgi:hypothetical protein